MALVIKDHSSQIADYRNASEDCISFAGYGFTRESRTENSDDACLVENHGRDDYNIFERDPR